MNNGVDIDRFVETPSLLADLCREVIARLDTEPPSPEEVAETTAMEAQLREIAKTIDRLDKMGVPVPDVLRAEKTRLAAALVVEDRSAEALGHLADSLGAVIKEIRLALQRRKPRLLPSGEKVVTINPDRLPRSVLRSAIIRALQTLGGSASRKSVIECMESELQGNFLPGDLVWLESHKCYAWKRAVENEREHMIKEGILRNDSPAGTWELSEEFR